MATLDDFLRCTDLDDLLHARRELSPLTADDIRRIKSIIGDWADQQSVANLLFHPSIIPTDIRFAAIDRALRSTDTPYFALAAVVGLQSIKPADVPPETRREWRQILLGMIQSESNTLAGRASVTMFSWFSESEACELLSLYPVADDTASKNILAFALSRLGHLSADEYAQRLAACGVAPNAIAAFNDHRAEYAAKTSEGHRGAGFMKCPLMCYIPNLSEVSIGAPTKPWWRFW